MSSKQSYEEKELLYRLSDDNAEAFQQLLLQYHKICYRIALDLINDQFVAEDIVQEAFLKVWLRRKKMAEVENFGGWLRTVTVNLVYDHLTEAKKEKTKAEGWLVELRSSGQHRQDLTKEENELKALLDDAIKLLSPRQRQTFELVKKEGYSREEAAGQLGISLETVKYHLDLAVKTIRAYCLNKIDPVSAVIVFSIIFKEYF